jgi:hypothetical protein
MAIILVLSGVLAGRCEDHPGDPRSTIRSLTRLDARRPCGQAASAASAARVVTDRPTAIAIASGTPLSHRTTASRLHGSGINIDEHDA